MKRILLASVAALGLAGTASAADLAVKAPVVYAPVFTWTSCYLGINGGWIGSNDDYETRRGVIAPGSDPNTIPLLNATQADIDLLGRSFSSDDSGGTAGGQFGCQVQWGSIVVGGEWDWAWSGLEEDNTAAFGRTPFVSNPANAWFPRTEHHHKQLDWFMTARARLGWAAWDRFMIYATGGVAWGAYDAYTQVIFTNPATGVSSFYNGGYREKKIGYTVGGGFEWAFANNWSFKGEFLYLDYGSFDYVSPRHTFGTVVNGVIDNRTWRTHVDASEYVVRVGINYLFHLGDPPVAARF